MSLPEMLVAIELVTLHMLDGRAVRVNPMAVQQLIPAQGANKIVAPKTRCLIRLAGNYVSVEESCDEVQRLLEGKL